MSSSVARCGRRALAESGACDPGPGRRQRGRSTVVEAQEQRASERHARATLMSHARRARPAHRRSARGPSRQQRDVADRDTRGTTIELERVFQRPNARVDADLHQQVPLDTPSNVAAPDHAPVIASRRRSVDAPARARGLNATARSAIVAGHLDRDGPRCDGRRPGA